MANANFGGPLYTIPLDSLDLNFLSKYISKPVAKTRPLWTRSRLDGESEYCYVQIVTQDEDEDCYSEPSDTYKCHICNIHVPNMCHEEHNKSAEHETMKNISQTALERVSNQMKIREINSNDKDIDKDVYYCGSCSKIIKKENKHRHESSAYHDKSKKKHSHAIEFYKIFKVSEGYDNEDDDNEETDDESDVEPDQVKYYIANNNINTTNKNLPTILDNVVDSVAQKPITENLTVKPTVSHTKKIIQPKKEEKPIATKAKTFEEHLKEMIKKYKLQVIPPVMKDEFILIVAPNGDTVQVSKEHFHSYRSDKNSVYCQLCKIWISQDTKPHDDTEVHVRNILKPINKNFARMIDTVSSHCVLCNEVVLTNSNHRSINDGYKKILNDTRIPKPAASGSSRRSGSVGVARSNTGTRSTSAAPTTPPVASDAVAPASAPAPVPQEPLPEPKKKSIKSLIDLSIINLDDVEILAEVKQLYTAQYHAAVVNEIFNIAVEKSAKDIPWMSKALLSLVASNTISPDNFVAGIKETLEFAPDLCIDIPMLYDHLGKILAPQIEKKHITFIQIFRLSASIISEKHGHLFLKAVIRDLKESMGPSFVKSKWQESGLQMKQWMDEKLVTTWLKDNKFEFLEGDAKVSEETKKILTPAQTQSKLIQLMDADETCECIKGWIQDNIGNSRNEDWFMQALIEAICEHAAFGPEGHDVPHFNQGRMIKYASLIHDFGETIQAREAYCLFGIQQLKRMLEHPEGLSLEIFQ